MFLFSYHWYVVSKSWRGFLGFSKTLYADKDMLQQSNGMEVTHTIKKKPNYIVTFFGENFIKAARQKNFLD